MSSHSVLAADWSDYDQKKGANECMFFSCEEQWELEYLVEKIALKHLVTRARIGATIIQCCADMPVPRLRKDVIVRVMDKLGYS